MQGKANPPDLKYPDEKRWYVLYVKSRSEKKVNARLQKQNLEVFLPLIKVVRQWSDRKKHMQVPLFNGYLFLYINSSAFSAVRMTEGVVNFVKQEGKFATVRNEKILSIKAFVETGLHITAHTDNFLPGQKVKINFGALKDCIGELISVENEKHFIIRVEAIGQVLKINVPQQYLQKA